MTAALAEMTPRPPAGAAPAKPVVVPVDPLEVLQRHVAANRFLPVPPEGMHNIGDGDFRAIGAEFLGHFVRIGGLRPTDAVLDIGCGLGRMALPLTQYLQAPKGRYHGIDVVADGIAWCAQAIGAVYPNFTFGHLDVQSDLYHPAGKAAADTVRLPVADSSVDFVVMTSVFTHLRSAAAQAYLGEVSRVLKPGGKLFASLFLFDDQTRAALHAKTGRLGFDPGAPGPEWIADDAHPLAAVAYDQAYFLGRAAAVGLLPAKPVVAGSWSGRTGTSYQDLCVLKRAAPRAEAAK